MAKIKDKNIFINLHIDDHPVLCTWPKNVPIPSIGEEVQINNWESRGFEHGFVYAIKHENMDTIHEVAIHIGKYSRIAEYQKEQSKE